MASGPGADLSQNPSTFVFRGTFHLRLCTWGSSVMDPWSNEQQRTMYLRGWWGTPQVHWLLVVVCTYVCMYVYSKYISGGKDQSVLCVKSVPHHYVKLYTAFIYNNIIIIKLNVR